MFYRSETSSGNGKGLFYAGKYFKTGLERHFAINTGDGIAKEEITMVIILSEVFSLPRRRFEQYYLDDIDLN